jgi:alkanesulfonate monooxygenase SsuD/methylene tetrahydromethanopterin reductase-like flavin-dependent oxidoreductase (luciferase family)
MGSWTMKRQLHLNLFIHGRGHHEASWRPPASSPLALTEIRYYQDLAQRAEAALIGSIFLADQLALGGDVAQAPRTCLEPITVLAAAAVATSRVGLIPPLRPPIPSPSTSRGSSPQLMTSATAAPPGIF